MLPKTEVRKALDDLNFKRSYYSKDLKSYSSFEQIISKGECILTAALKELPNRGLLKFKEFCHSAGQCYPPIYLTAVFNSELNKENGGLEIQIEPNCAEAIVMSRTSLQEQDYTAYKMIINPLLKITGLSAQVHFDDEFDKRDNKHKHYHFMKKLADTSAQSILDGTESLFVLL